MHSVQYACVSHVERCSSRDAGRTDGGEDRAVPPGAEETLPDAQLCSGSNPALRLCCSKHATACG